MTTDLHSYQGPWIRARVIEVQPREPDSSMGLDDRPLGVVTSQQTGTVRVRTFAQPRYMGPPPHRTDI